MGSKIHFGIGKDLEKRIRLSGRILFFFDYDGTLVAIKKRPGLALLSISTRKLITGLSGKKWAKVFIVTGRNLENILGLMRIRSISYVGNHGFELKDPHLKFSNTKAEQAKGAIALIFRELKNSLRHVKGVIIENKYYTLSVHYRLVDKRDIAILKKRFYNITIPYIRKGAIYITRGKKVFELRPNIRWNKGTMVRWLLKEISVRDRVFPIYIGDDVTDEDAFSALGKKGMSVLVAERKRPTKARFRLRSPREVMSFIKFIISLKENKNG